MSNENTFLLSLGHNSSAIFTDGTRVIGYEQERLDRIKSSSAPPVDALLEIRKHINHEKLVKVPMFITHWFDQFDKLPICKYSENLISFASYHENKIITHTKDFTHHDAHAWSSLCFFRHYFPETYRQMTRDEQIAVDISYIHFLVADGFGNRKEVLSLYRSMGERIELVMRVYGYGNSLGLMYQYATKFCGMKMNQDEYKFLGYESQITYTVDLLQKQIIDEMSSEQAGQFIVNWASHNIMPVAVDDLIDFGALHQTEEYWHDIFSKLLERVEIFNPTCDFARIIIGYFIQQTLEKALIKFVKSQGIRNLVLSGGVFYNVKANHALLKTVKGLFSVVPVAGDQGASIGFYEKFVGHFNWDTLCIGNRDMSGFDSYTQEKNMLIITDEDYLVETLYAKLSTGQICNLITDKMEYGPRALGNTSSLFLPTDRNTEINNKLNQRNEVMPFAPLIAAEAMPLVFEHDYRRVVGSDRFMIVTYDYKMPITDDVRGVYHVYPFNTHVFSGRPEVIDYQRNRPLHRVLTGLWFHDRQLLLTNTSYNYHGEPIVFSAKDIVNTHRRQMDNSKVFGGQTPKVNLIVYIK